MRGSRRDLSEEGILSLVDRKTVDGSFSGAVDVFEGLFFTSFRETQGFLSLVVDLGPFRCCIRLFSRLFHFK